MASSDRARPDLAVAGAPPVGNPLLAGPGDWLNTRRFALLLAGLIFAAFPQVVLGLQTFVVRDFGFFAYPLAYYQRQCFWHGQLPQWDPYNNCGVPFLAQWNTMPLYPPSLLYLLLPLGWSLSFFCLLHLWFAGLGMYRLAWRWSGNRLAAAVAGLVFAFNGLSLNLLMWPSHIATLSWMPWVVLCVERGWQQGARALVVAALAGAMQMLAGGPETIFFTWLILAALWGVQLVWGCPVVPQADSSVATPKQPAARSALLWRFPLLVLLVAGLAAVQLLPFLDLVAHSQRGGGYADTRWSMPASGWANFLVPMLFGHVWSMGVFFQYEQYWTSSYYLGVGTLLLALLAVATVRRPRVWLLSAAAGVAFLLALGDQTGFGRWLRHLVPQLSLMTYPVKFVTVITFAAPLLAAFGLARLLGSERARGPVHLGARMARPLALQPGGPAPAHYWRHSLLGLALAVPSRPLPGHTAQRPGPGVVPGSDYFPAGRNLPRAARSGGAGERQVTWPAPGDAAAALAGGLLVRHLDP